METWRVTIQKAIRETSPHAHIMNCTHLLDTIGGVVFTMAKFSLEVKLEASATTWRERIL